MVRIPDVSQKTDVFVVGGGPAGLASAIAMRRQGLSVTVADVFHPPIDKACGEGLMPDSLAELCELGIQLDGMDTAEFCGVRFIGEAGSVEAEFPRGSGIGIRRTLLHQALVDRARDAGVTMLWGARVSAVRDGAVLVDGRRIASRWIVGADGENSQVRRWAGLTASREFDRRIGMRQHFALEPWSKYVEIYWGEHSQAYVTPVAAREVCVAMVARRPSLFQSALEEFPQLRARLGTAPAAIDAKGAVTVTRKLKSVARGRFALVGEASGSTDAITGEGLAMSFRQALALARAVAGEDISRYQAAHDDIRRLPHLMGRSMLLMDKSAWIRRHALRALAAKPGLFQRMLAVNVGELPLLKFAIPGLLDLSWGMLTA
ncbi:MAG TPA: NAD(P)/FAD-dependent oxidoreductase [Terriglobales bacterium]|nr:NAD(P)/FAD-dependent oxidoreductase [Terriglobales bacterium]